MREPGGKAGKTVGMKAGARTGVIKRSIAISGHSTSVSLEEPFWEGLRDMAAARGVALAALVREIDATRQGYNLSSALRLAVLAYCRSGAKRAEERS